MLGLIFLVSKNYFFIVELSMQLGFLYIDVIVKYYLFSCSFESIYLSKIVYEFLSID